MRGRKRDKGKQVAQAADTAPPQQHLVDEEETQEQTQPSEAHLTFPPHLFDNATSAPLPQVQPTMASSHVSSCQPAQRLHITPRGREFSAQTVCSRRIGKIIEQKFTGPWRAWKKVPLEHRDFWFSQFELYFWWEEENGRAIRKVFETVGSNVLKNRLYDARTTNRRPLWITELVWAALLLQWGQQEHIEQRDRNKKNRDSDCDGQGFPLHLGGSISHLTHMDKLREKYGREPSVAETFMETHSRLNSKGERQWSDARSEARHGAYVQTYEPSSEDVGSSEPPPPLQLQIERWAEMEGSKKKGRVYGLAGLADRLLPGSSSSGQTQRERELEAEVASMRQEMSQMQAKMDAFEKTQAAIHEFMRTAQQNEGQSSAFRRPAADLPVPSTISPMPYLQPPRDAPRGTFTVSTPFGPPRSPHQDADDSGSETE